MEEIDFMSSSNGSQKELSVILEHSDECKSSKREYK